MTIVTSIRPGGVAEGMDTLRLALLSTPRSGNSWLRHMLARALDLNEQGIHAPGEVNWCTLPPRLILQFHWRPEEGFESLLREHGFRVLVIARHPLDVLISILAYSQHEGGSAQWLDGTAGNERSIETASPSSEAFLTYATGPRAAALLSVSGLWWRRPDVCRVRYEDLVDDPAGQIAGMLATFGESARKPLAEIVTEAAPDTMRALSTHWLYHIWHAQPGLWRRLLVASDAQRICAAHQAVLTTLGYVCDPDPSLGQVEAQHGWDRLDRVSLKRTLRGAKKTLHEAETSVEQQRRELAAMQEQLANLANQCANAESMSQQLADLQSQCAQLKEATERLHDFDGLGPWSLGTAQRLHGLSGRFPRLSAALKRLALAGRRAVLRMGRAASNEPKDGPPQRN